MKIIKIYFIMTFVLTALNISFGQNHFSGEVSGTWSADTIFVDGNLTVPENETLIIEAGTNVYFTGEYELNVYGTLTAEGSVADSIFFFSDSLQETSSYPYYKGFWYGITFHATDSTGQKPSSFDYCNFKYAYERWLDEASLAFNRTFGGGLIFYKSKIQIANSTFEKCYAYGSSITALFSTGVVENTLVKKSGFIELIKSELYIENSEITKGLGIKLESSMAQINNTKIHNNPNYFQYSNGFGAVMADSSTFTLYKCEITNNVKSGVVAAFSKPTIKNCLIEGNGLEGGFFIESPIKMKETEILQNGALGLRFQSAENWGTVFSSKIDNSVIAKNGSGGISFLSNNSAEIVNCTIADNNSSNAWGGIKLGDADVHLKNCIVFNNGNDLDFQAGGSYVYSIVQGNYAGDDTASTNLQNVDPLFRNSEEADYHLKTVNCSYSFSSPAIDAGSPDILDFSLDCNAGLGTSRSDLGAYGGNYGGTISEVKRKSFSEVPSKFELKQNYPNPFNPSTTIEFNVPRKSFVTLGVYNSLGQKVKTLLEKELNGGNHAVEFDASSLSSGVYFYRLEASDFTTVRKMILLK